MLNSPCVAAAILLATGVTSSVVGAQTFAPVAARYSAGAALHATKPASQAATGCRGETCSFDNVIAGEGIASVIAGRGDTVLVASTATHEDQARSLDGPLRIGAGLLGSVAGVFIGGVAGAGTASGCHGEYCALGPVLVGGAIGSVAFAALASAAPQLGSTCSGETRVARGVVGGLTGALTGGALGLVGGPLCVFTYLAGAGVGAGWAAKSC